MTSYFDENGRLIFPYEVGSEDTIGRWAIGYRGERGDGCIIARYLKGFYPSYESAARALKQYAEEHKLKPGY